MHAKCEDARYTRIHGVLATYPVRQRAEDKQEIAGIEKVKRIRRVLRAAILCTRMHTCSGEGARSPRRDWRYRYEALTLVGTAMFSPNGGLSCAGSLMPVP